jgi:hypothetical protein
MVRGDSCRMVRKDRFACTTGDWRSQPGSCVAASRVMENFLSSRGLIEKPDGSSRRTDSSGGIFSEFRFGFAAKSGKNLAFIFAGHKEISVASTIEDDRHERQAIRRFYGHTHGHNSALLFLESGRSRDERCRAGSPLIDNALERCGITVEAHHAVSAGHQALRHECAHLSEANHSEFH